MRTKKADEPYWCQLYREKIIKPAQRQRQTEQHGRTMASRAGLYNTPRWKRLRNRFIKEHPLCVVCRDNELIRPAKIVDHIIPVDQAPDRMYDYNNLQSLCVYHHVLKTNKDKKQKLHDERLKKGRALMDDLERNE